LSFFLKGRVRANKGFKGFKDFKDFKDRALGLLRRPSAEHLSGVSIAIPYYIEAGGSASRGSANR